MAVLSAFGNSTTRLKPSAFLLSLLVGIVLCHLYLNSIRVHDAQTLPFGIMWIGAIVSSISMFCLYNLSSKSDRAVKWFLLAIYMLALGFLLMPTSRYSTIAGYSDILMEFSVAKVALQAGRWPEELLSLTHASGALGGTLLPAMVAVVSGTTLENVFGFVMKFVAALTPIMLYLFLRRTFRDVDVAITGTYIYVTSFWFVFLFPYLTKLQVSTFVLLSALLLLSMKKSIGSAVGAIVLLPSVVVAHYTTGGQTQLLVIGSVVASIITKRIVKTPVERSNHDDVLSIGLAVFYGVCVFAWYLFGIFPVFSMGISMGERAFTELLELTPNIHLRYLVGSPMGPLMTAWLDLQFALIGLGGIYAMFLYRSDRRRLSLALVGFMFVGISALGLIPGLSTLVSVAIEPERWLFFGYIFFGAFMAILLLRLGRSHWKVLGRRVEPRLILAIFMLISVPMNMALASERPLLLYHAENDLTSEQAALQTPIHPWDLLFADWIASKVPMGTVIASDLGGSLVVRMSQHEYELIRSLSLPHNVNYLLIPELYRKSGVLAAYAPGRERVVVVVSGPENVRNSNILFDNGHSQLSSSVGT